MQNTSAGGFTDWAALPMSAAEAAFDAVCTCLGCAKTDREPLGIAQDS